MGMDGQRHAPVPLSPGKNRYPLYRRMSGPQGRPGRVRKISPLAGIRSPDRPARSESLYRLSYPGSHVIYIYIYVYYLLHVLNDSQVHLRLTTPISVLIWSSQRDVTFKMRSWQVKFCRFCRWSEQSWSHKQKLSDVIMSLSLVIFY